MNSWMGHHRPYFLLYTKLLLDLNYKVDVLCLGEDEIKSYFQQELADKIVEIRKPKLFICQKILLQLLKIIEHFNISFSIPSVSSLGCWFFVKNAAMEADPRNESFVFILDLQGYLIDIPPFLQRYLLPQAWAGLYICTPLQDKFLQQCQSQSLIYNSSFNGLCLLNERLVTELKNKFQAIRVHHFPDVSYLQCNSDKPSLVLELVKVAGRRKIVFLASLTKKHGLIQFLRLADVMSDSEILFFAMGLVRLEGYDSDELDYINDRLSKPLKNLLVCPDIYPPEETLNALYRYSNIAFICYPDFQDSSNKLTKAIGLGTPVLVAHNTLLAQRVKNYHLGYAVDPRNLSEMADAINFLLYHFQFDDSLIKAFTDYHSEQNLKSKLAEIIQ
ncbi:glycosyltransferase [Nostoc sp.]|uniref:glycosyltransferase n=1 Tax=Nostoc sp. TaxID=1180 RepID=UPI002FF9B416